VSRSLLSVGARKVLYRLHRSGQAAYLVGGAVRDILLNRTPKDFDVVTDARPREVRRLFRNSRVIGRRFRLVHVLFGNEIVEVSTFRASPEPDPHPDETSNGDTDLQHSCDADVYGTPAEDAFRRDFTINALFYDIADFSVIDYVGGLEDLAAGVVRTIGDPVLRFEEDPVRMMRALEYAARLGFVLHPDTARAIEAQHERVLQAAPARLAYELLEALRSGHSAEVFRLFHKHGVLGQLHAPAAERASTVLALLAGLDRRLVNGAEPAEPVLLASLVAPHVFEWLTPSIGSQAKLDNVELLERLDCLLARGSQHVPVSNHVNHVLRHGLFLLSKLVRPPGRNRQVAKVARSEAFPVAWSLLELWVEAAEGPRELMEGWSRALARARQGGSDGRPRRRPRGGRSGRRRRS
jgi:poly(A) polymerase